MMQHFVARLAGWPAILFIDEASTHRASGVPICALGEDFLGSERQSVYVPQDPSFKNVDHLEYEAPARVIARLLVVSFQRVWSS